MLGSKLDFEGYNEKLLEVQKLLEDSDNNELLDISRKLSPNGTLIDLETKLGKKIKNEEYFEKYGKNYNIQDIYNECIKYDLTFRPAKYFQGEYSLNFLKKIKSIKNETDLIVSEYDLSKQVFVLLPADKKQSYKRERYFKNNGKGFKDPMIFVKIDKENFLLVDGDKKYIGIKQWLLGLRYRNEISHFLFQVLRTIFQLLLIILIIKNINLEPLTQRILGVMSCCAIILYNIIFFNRGRENNSYNLDVFEDINEQNHL